MSSASHTLVVFGSGPGIGNHVAAEFASHGFNHIILLARNEARLQDDAAFVAKANSNVKVDTLKVDLADLDSIPSVLKKIDRITTSVDVVLFNAARIRVSKALTTPVSELQEDFTTTNLALYIIAQWAIPKLQSLTATSPSHKPSLLVTNSHLPWDPIPDLLSLSLVKASQRNLVQSIGRAFEKDGIHAGLIAVEGTVTLENKVLNPTTIAERTWGFFEKGEGLEVNIREE